MSLIEIAAIAIGVISSGAFLFTPVILAIDTEKNTTKSEKVCDRPLSPNTGGKKRLKHGNRDLKRLLINDSENDT